jgi:hypothetical protein
MTTIIHHLAVPQVRRPGSCDAPSRHMRIGVMQMKLARWGDHTPVPQHQNHNQPPTPHTHHHTYPALWSLYIAYIAQSLWRASQVRFEGATTRIDTANPWAPGYPGSEKICTVTSKTLLTGIPQAFNRRFQMVFSDLVRRYPRRLKYPGSLAQNG